MTRTRILITAALASPPLPTPTPAPATQDDLDSSPSLVPQCLEYAKSRDATGASLFAPPSPMSSSELGVSLPEMRRAAFNSALGAKGPSLYPGASLLQLPSYPRT